MNKIVFVLLLVLLLPIKVNSQRTWHSEREVWKYAGFNNRISFPLWEVVESIRKDAIKHHIAFHMHFKSDSTGDNKPTNGFLCDSIFNNYVNFFDVFSLPENYYKDIQLHDTLLELIEETKNEFMIMPYFSPRSGARFMPYSLSAGGIYEIWLNNGYYVFRIHEPIFNYRGVVAAMWSFNQLLSGPFMPLENYAKYSNQMATYILDYDGRKPIYPLRRTIDQIPSIPNEEYYYRKASGVAAYAEFLSYSLLGYTSNICLRDISYDNGYFTVDFNCAARAAEIGDKPLCKYTSYDIKGLNFPDFKGHEFWRNNGYIHLINNLCNDPDNEIVIGVSFKINPDTESVKVKITEMKDVSDLPNCTDYHKEQFKEE